MQNNPSILIGNSFPLSLIRRPVRIEPRLLVELKKTAKGKSVASYWGHTNTLERANQFSGFDLTPPAQRPVLELQESGLPTLGGQTFYECWIISPDYIEPFRPAIGEEGPPCNIKGWQILKLTWEIHQ